MRTCQNWREVMTRKPATNCRIQRPAPLEGGPFVTLPGGKDTMEREPRVRGAKE